MTEQATPHATYTSTATVADIAERLRGAHRIATTSHQKIDGDALGSMLAIKRALESAGKEVDIYTIGPLDPNLLLLAGETACKRVEDHAPADSYDLIVVVDTGAWSQLEPVREWLTRHHDRVMVIDHHSRGDADIAQVRLIDSEKASTTHLLIDVLDALEAPLTGGQGGVAEALFIGLATDTGWFRYNNAHAEVFASAARLLAQGVDKSRLYQIIEETQRPERLALESRALASLQYARNGSVAIMSLGPDDFHVTGASTEDVTGLVNAPLLVGDVRVSILLTQTEPGLTKVSFRSKPPLPGSSMSEFVDVNDLAHQFGGGGHVHAAGARIPANLDEACEQVTKAVEALP